MKMLHNIKQFLEDLAEVCQAEWGRIFGNTGVLLIIFVAGVGYPLIFNGIYTQENLYDVPVAVVDDARCEESERFIHKMDATPEIEVRYEASSMAEAKHLMANRKVNGIIHFPSDYGERLARLVHPLWPDGHHRRAGQYAGQPRGVRRCEALCSGRWIHQFSHTGIAHFGHTANPILWSGHAGRNRSRGGCRAVCCPRPFAPPPLRPRGAGQWPIRSSTAPLWQ